MQDISEALRLPSPAPRPQALAFDGEKLWMGSIETDRLYAIDPVHWTVSEEAKLPGKPWGMTVLGDELRVICGEGPTTTASCAVSFPVTALRPGMRSIADYTGSQLSYDGTWLYVSQWYNRRLLGIDERGNVVRTIDLPRGVCGQCYSDGAFYLITTEEEE